MTTESATGLKIRLLSGPYAGQEVFLPEGSVILGNSSECDFIVHDLDKKEKEEGEEEKLAGEEELVEEEKLAGEEELVEEEKLAGEEELVEEEEPVGEEGFDKLKFELIVSEGSVVLQINPEEPFSKILINGEPAEPKDNQLILPEKKVIEVGKISFVLGAEKQDLSNIRKQKPGGRFSINIPTPNKKIILIAAVFVIFTTVATALFFFKSGTPAPQTTKKEATAKLHNMIAGLTSEEGLKDIKASWKKDDTLELSGYAASSDQKSLLTNKLDSLSVTYNDNIINMEDLVNNTTLLLQDKGYKSTKVAPDKRAGFIIITGKILGDLRWDKVSKQLIKDINGLKGWRIISTQTRFSKVLLELLSDRSLSRLLSVVDRDNITIITGLLNSEQAGMLNRLVNEAKEEVKSNREVIYQNILYSGSLYPEYTPSPLASFGGDNDSAYFILENGMRCSVGKQLPSGYIITSIGRDGITLEKSGDVAHFPVFT